MDKLGFRSELVKDQVRWRVMFMEHGRGWIGIFKDSLPIARFEDRPDKNHKRGFFPPLLLIEAIVDQVRKDAHILLTVFDKCGKNFLQNIKPTLSKIT